MSPLATWLRSGPNVFEVPDARDSIARAKRDPDLHSLSKLPGASFSLEVIPLKQESPTVSLSHDGNGKESASAVADE